MREFPAYWCVNIHMSRDSTNMVVIFYAYILPFKCIFTLQLSNIIFLLYCRVIVVKLFVIDKQRSVLS